MNVTPPSVRELLENRRNDLIAQIAELRARLDEVNYLISLTGIGSAVTTARNPRTIKREQS